MKIENQLNFLKNYFWKIFLICFFSKNCKSEFKRNCIKFVTIMKEIIQDYTLDYKCII